ncbi:hypothetical protein NM208_g4491 [Fusarium decemcellulare]|uniref:Uncharacterized protein n=1 Tax=Fusarium decemcellulare TaxID=57161 RepID=A0ACC1SKX4_9HYPO|nr:hypothetical protein NM208_g4491 [Fusarium decemcellulare]
MGRDSPTPAAVAEATELVDMNHSSLIFPDTFTIRTKADSTNRFTIRSDDGSPRFSLISGTNSEEQAKLVVFSGPEEEPHVLGTITHGYTGADIKLENTTPPIEFRMSYRLLGNRRAVHQFSVNLPDRTDFEWQNDGSGWKLIKPVGAGEEPEVLATATLNMGTNKPPRFVLTKSETTTQLGERWKLVAIMSCLRIWDKVRLAWAKDPEEEEGAMISFCACTLCVVM